jgi:hypothetical protein
MGLVQRAREFDPLDVESLDRVCEVSWEYFVTREPFRDIASDPKRQEKLRKLVLAFAKNNFVNNDLLCELMLGHLRLAGLSSGARFGAAYPKRTLHSAL